MNSRCLPPFLVPHRVVLNCRRCDWWTLMDVKDSTINVLKHNWGTMRCDKCKDDPYARFGPDDKPGTLYLIKVFMENGDEYVSGRNIRLWHGRHCDWCDECGFNSRRELVKRCAVHEAENEALEEEYAVARESSLGAPA